MKTPDSRTKEEVYQFVSGFLSKVHALGIVNESGYVELMIKGKVHRFCISEMECNYETIQGVSMDGRLERITGITADPKLTIELTEL